MGDGLAVALDAGGGVAPGDRCGAGEGEAPGDPCGAGDGDVCDAGGAPRFGFGRRGGTCTFSGGGAPRNGVPCMSPLIETHRCLQIQAMSLVECEYDREAIPNGTERSSRAEGDFGVPPSLKAGPMSA